MDAPEGYEWKHYEVRKGRRYPVGDWLEIVYVATVGSLAKLKVLVKIGQKASKAIDQNEEKR